MNIIEQLGGYESAKVFMNGECSDGFDVQGLRDALLQYRKDHNIFEIGDPIVSTLKNDGEFWKPSICIIDGFHKKMVISKSGGHVIHHYEYRHCTDKEIKQGYRDD